MANSNGYVMQWNPVLNATGVLFGCGGDANGTAVAFRLVDVDDSDVRQRLSSSAAFNISDTLCGSEDASLFWVEFDALPGQTFAMNIVGV